MLAINYELLLNPIQASTAVAMHANTKIKNGSLFPRMIITEADPNQTAKIDKLIHGYFIPHIIYTMVWYMQFLYIPKMYKSSLAPHTL